jgi:hypothetical protein
MFILKSMLDPIQSECKKSHERGKLFVAVLLAILLPAVGSRSSQLLRIIKSAFGFKITRRRFYIMMASPKLPWMRLWQCLWRLIPSPLTDGRLLLAADDSINPKTGKRIHGCDYHYDHAAKANQSKYVWSQNIVQVGLLKWIHGRFACLPLSWCFYRLQKSNNKEFKTKIEQVIDMVLIIYRFFKCPILLVVDNWFACQTLVKPLRKEMKTKFQLLSRLRTNAKLYDKCVPQYSGRGRPRKYGKCIGNVKQEGKKRKKKVKKYDGFIYGKKRTVKAISGIFYLKTLGMRVHIVWVYYRKNTIALFTTDLTLDVEKIIEYYSAKWKQESGFKELKQDIGSQKTQSRTKNAVTNHLNFCMMAVTLTWIYAAKLGKQPSRRNSYNRQTSFAFSDVRYMIANAISQQDFLRVIFKSQKTPKNNLISTIIRLVA